MFALLPFSIFCAAFAGFSFTPRLCSCAAPGQFSALRLHPALRAKAQFQKFRAQWASRFIGVARSFTIGT
jgi:hypothetical protein